MRTHTSEFKEELKVFGRQIKGKITYYPSYNLISENEENILTEADLQIISEQANYDEPIEINEEDIFSISIIKNGDLLQSLMKEFDFETKEELNIGSVVNPQFGLLVNEGYEYLDYGNYIINSKEFNMDTETWSYVCYDKMLFSMVKYRGLSNVQYPITIKQFVNKLCDKVGLEFEDSEFVNQDQLIYEDLYKNRDVTYRDIFDEISKIVAGNLLINDNDKLKVGYPNKASYSENASGSDISIEAVEEPISDVKLEGDTQQNTSILPSGYTQVDYIQSSGTQYIDTGHYPSSNNDELEIQASYVGGNTTSCLFGAFTNGSYYQLNKTTTANQFRLITRTGDVFYTFEDYSSKHTYLLDGNVLYIDGVEIIVGTKTVNFSSQTLYLFSRNYNGTANQFGSWRLYSCKIITNGSLVCYFIPCYRNSDNVVGLYDIVNNVFHTNQGTGAFTYGSIANNIPNPDYPQNVEVVTGEQNIQITGKNLLYSNLTYPFTINGVAVTKEEDGSITLNGTQSGGTMHIIFNNEFFDSIKNYVGREISISLTTNGEGSFSNFGIKNGTAIDLLVSRSPSLSKTQTLNLNNYTNIYFDIWFNNTSRTFVNYNIKPQVEVGKATTYEPYQSQNYPINLGKNLFDKNNVNYLNAYIGTGSRRITSENRDRTIYIKCKPNTTYTIQKMVQETTSMNRFVVGTTSSIPQINDRLHDFHYYEGGTTNTTLTLTTGSTANYLCVFCWSIDSVTTFEDMLDSIQIEVGSQATSYAPYFEPIELCKIGSSQDYIYENNGDWYLHKETETEILPPNDTTNRVWTKSVVNKNNTYIYIFRDHYLKIGSKVYSNMFLEYTATYLTNNNIYGCCYNTTGDGYPSIRVGMTLSGVSTVANFRTWLSANQPTFYYELATPTDTKITDTNLIQQLDNLKNATLYNGVNNISASGDLPSILNLDYISEYESINEDYLKDTNVRMSERIGVINSVAILDSDNDLQYISEDTQSIKENEMTRVTITDNLIAMNGETQEIADNILNKLNGLYYYANDLQTTGVCYYDFLDMFNVEARGNTYQCLLLNNEITITQGIEEHIFTERFEEVETSSNEYTTSVISNKAVQFKINQQEGKIESKVEKDGVISAINQSAEEIQINASKLSFEGATINMTADNVKIKGENLDIDSSGVITLTDNSAASSLSDETLHSAYVIESKDTVDRAGTIETLNFKNEIVANGRKITLENNWEYQGTTGGGKAGIIEGVYSQPRLTFYSQSNDYESTTGSGSYQDLDISLIAGIKYTNIQNGTTSTPLIITPSGNITCVSLTQTSKEENKKNFEKLINAKDILNNVDIYKYNYINEDNKVKKSIGFVIGDDFNYSEEITSQNNDGANIYSMVSVLWQVVKEQQEEINELKEMIKNGKY